jgi:hypothetical protein
MALRPIEMLPHEERILWFMSPDSPQPERHRSKKLFVFLIALILLLLSASAFSIYLIYTVQHQQVVSLTTQLAKTRGMSQGSTPQIHFVESIGYPFIAEGVMPPVVDIKLGLPMHYQAVRYPSDNNNRGNAESALTDKYNDEMGRWEIGDSGYGQSAPSQLAIVAIDHSWLATASDPGIVRGYIADGVSPTTPDNKKMYVANVKSDTKTCSQNSKSGFSTNDHIFTICYALDTGIQAYEPFLTFTGYAEVQGHPLILTGSIALEQGKYDLATSQALANNVRLHNKYPQSTLAAVNELVNALKQTTTTITARS